ncbi:MAG: restriction endonuclease subunit S, partial [Anaerolineales bacterium]|nr:restriction endonuclease subunit S [Anaerolineales bacterium]
IPEEWEYLTANDLCDEICVGIVIKPAQYYVDSGIPTLRSANIREASITTTDLVYISENSNKLLSKSKLQQGYVVSVRTGYPGTSAVVPKAFDGANCVDLVISKPGSEILPEYLATWINSPFGKDQVLQNQGGLAQQHFNVSEMKKLLVLKPKIEEQKRILEVLLTHNALVAQENIRLTKLQRTKTGLMQDLLTGKVSVEPLLNDD